MKAILVRSLLTKQLQDTVSSLEKAGKQASGKFPKGHIPRLPCRHESREDALCPRKRLKSGHVALLDCEPPEDSNCDLGTWLVIVNASQIHLLTNEQRLSRCSR